MGFWDLLTRQAGRVDTFFGGGVHPHDSKYLTSHRAIRNAPIPSVCVIPMHQHMGKAAQCVVNVGDTVREGMLIGKANGFFSANVHCPIPGKVTDIREVFLTNGIKCQAVVAELEGEFDRSGKSRVKKGWSSLSGEELLKKVQDMGIVGLGGATFPTHMKYFIREGLSVESFVVNGVECEPFLTGDHRLMLERTVEILEGTKIVEKILNPEKVYIGIEQNKPDAIQMMEEAIIREKLAYQVKPLKVKYPQGDEKQLLKAIINREVPSGGLPIDIGAVVSNVGTVFAIYEAVVYDKPLVERCVTVTGPLIKTPANLKARIGTRIGDLIEDCGGLTGSPWKLVAGGPMMGFAFYDMDAPVTKGVSGVVALDRKASGRQTETNCIHCGQCISVCPFGLNPTHLYKLIDHMEYEAASNENLMDCKECGCCAYVCPSRIPLVQGIKLGKFYARKMKVK